MTSSDPAHWLRLMEVIETCDPERFALTMMPYALALLETSRWQHVSRAVPWRWLKDLSQGSYTPWIRLCNTLKLTFTSKPYAHVFHALRQQPWLLDGACIPSLFPAISVTTTWRSSRASSLDSA